MSEPDPRPLDAEPSEDRELTRRSLPGLSWSYLDTIVVAVLQIGITAALARLLTPRAFGLVALGNLTLSFVNYFARAGITQALIQKPRLSAHDVRAGFTLSAGLGVIFSTGVAAVAPFAAGLFGDPELIPVLRLMGLSMFLSGVKAPSEALLRRQLRFKTLALRNIAAYITGYAVVGIALAVAGAGVYALVAAVLSAQLLDAVLSYAAVRHPVLPTRDRSSYRAIFGFGSRVSVISFLEFLGSHADTAAVGRFAGTSPLGLYNRGNLLAQLPFEYATTALSTVLYPAFSRAQRDTARVRGAFLGATGAIATMVIPAAAGLAVAASEIVQVVLGRKFLGTIPLLPWLAAFAAVSMVTHLSSMLAEARAALNAKLAISTAKVAVLVGLLAMAVGRDLWSYAAALFGAAVFEHVAYLLLMRRVIDASARQVISAYLPALATAAIVVAAIGAVRWPLLSLGWGPGAVLPVEMATGVVVLVLSLRFGPLRVVRADVAWRLHLAGALDGTGIVARALRTLVGTPDREAR